MNQTPLFAAMQTDEDFQRGLLEGVRGKASKCERCSLHEYRRQALIGRGCPVKPRIMFVGEAPSVHDDRAGRLFVGRAEDLLSKMLDRLRLTWDEVYLANVVCCRPPNNRRPLSEETKACAPFLQNQLDIVDPQMIVALGLTAAQALLKVPQKMASLRTEWFWYKRRVPLRVTYHPVFALRVRGAQQYIWQDMDTVRERLALMESNQ